MSFFDTLEHAVWKGVEIAVPGVGIAEEINNAVSHLQENHAYVANGLSADIAVMVTANPNWGWADVTAAVVQLVASMGEDAPADLTAIREAMTLMDLYKATRLLRSVAGVAVKLWQVLASHGATIKPGEAICVNERSVSAPLNYLSPSQYAAVSGGSDIQLLIMSKDLTQIACFNSNSDSSWIATPQGYCRAKHGTLWQPADGPHPWS